MTIFPTVSIFMVRDLCRGVAATLVGHAPSDIAMQARVYLSDHHEALLAAMRRGSDLAWLAVEVGLAGDSWLATFQGQLAAGEAPVVARQLAGFLQQVRLSSLPIDHARCLEQLRAARQSGLLDAGAPSVQQMDGIAGNYDRYADPARRLEGDKQTLVALAGSLKAKFPELARFLSAEAAAGQSLLATATSYFFRRAVEKDATLGEARLQKLPAAQEQGFQLLERTLDAVDRLGGRLDGDLSELVPVEEKPSGPVPVPVPVPVPTPVVPPAPVRREPGPIASRAAPVAPTVEAGPPATGDAILAEVEGVIGRLEHRLDARDLEKCTTLLRHLIRSKNPRAGALLRQARQALARLLTPDTLTFLPRGDGRVGNIPGRAAALAAMILFRLWESPA